LKGFRGTNTLAYYEHWENADVNFLITLYLCFQKHSSGGASGGWIQARVTRLSKILSFVGKILSFGLLF
jgi:hypothetical protein